MTDPGQFGASKLSAAGSSSGLLDCTAFEGWLAESAENSLSATALEQLRGHAENCAACNEKLTLARSGRDWLVMLKQEALEPPADMVAKILGKTSLAGMAVSQVHDRVPPYRAMQDSRNASIARNVVEEVPTKIPVWQRSSVVVLRRTLLEPRLAMVAAMAFFSISLTLNLLGVRLTGTRPADLTPRNMRRAITRQYAQTNARVIRYYENLPIVYKVEARVEQLRRAAETSAPSNQEEAKPPKQSSDLMTTPRMEAAFHLPSGMTAGQKRRFA